MASPIYTQIADNKRRTFLLIALFVLLIVAIGAAYAWLTDAGLGPLGFAGTFAAVSALASYYAGDRMALWSAGAVGPLEKRQQPYLYRMLENLTIAAGVPMPKLYVIPDPAINAFATGRDPRHASVAVTVGAVEKLTNEELEGVLAHELSHIRNYDIRVMTIVVVLAGTVAILADWFLRMGLGGRRREGGLLPLALVGLLLALLAPLAAELIKLAVSRRREYLADASGALLTRFPEGLARALEKIGREARPMLRRNTATAHLFLSEPAAGRWQTLFSTHPPLADRIRILRGMTAG